MEKHNKISVYGQADQQLILLIEKALNYKINKENEICLVLQAPEKDVLLNDQLRVYDEQKQSYCEGIFILKKVAQQILTEFDLIPSGWRSFSIFESDDITLIDELKKKLPKLDGIRFREIIISLELIEHIT